MREGDREATARVTQAAARAASAAAGVAFLRPGLAELVRGTALPYRQPGPGSGPRTSGVRARRQGDPERWHVELHLAVLDGHRVLDVTRAVRVAVTEAVRAELGPQPPRVTVAVTVTDIA